MKDELIRHVARAIVTMTPQRKTLPTMHEYDRMPDSMREVWDEAAQAALAAIEQAGYAVVPRESIKALAKALCEADGENVEAIFAETEHHGDCALAERSDTYTCALCLAEHYRCLAKAAMEAMLAAAERDDD